MQYSSLERVKMALEHKEPDKVPFDLGGSGVTGINLKSLARLKLRNLFLHRIYDIIPVLM